VHSDECLVLIRKTGSPLPPGVKIAGAGQKGIQRETLGPGRYFLNPLTWETEHYKLVDVPAGDPASWEEHEDLASADYQEVRIKGAWPKVGVLVNRVGKPAPPERGEVVGPDEQGIQLEVLTPGTYRINPYEYEVKLEDATVIPTGYVGIVTSQLGHVPPEASQPAATQASDMHAIEGRLASAGERGVLRDVLQPGIYYLNPYAYKVKAVWVGYNLMSQVKTTKSDEVISFPSKDGFTIQVDVTVVWGLQPPHAPAMISGVGEVERIRQIILSQIRSICRNVGSDFVSTDFIQGEKRELYQKQVTETLRRVCEERDLEILIALIQNIEVHGGSDTKISDSDLKRTIQRGFIARETDLTKQKQRETAKVLAELEAAKAEIPVSREKVTADTRKKVAEVKAEADKQAEEINAQRDLEVAQIERQIAELEAQTTLLLGKAQTQVEELKNRADADGKRMMIEAFGTGRAYNLYTFAESFDPQSIQLYYAGEGTFWTDLNRLQDAAALELLKKSAPEKK
jgi:regulator of protease activity HflC (stomatin/prohibitin superfamily)